MLKEIIFSSQTQNPKSMSCLLWKARAEDVYGYIRKSRPCFKIKLITFCVCVLRCIHFIAAYITHTWHIFSYMGSFCNLFRHVSKILQHHIFEQCFLSICMYRWTGTGSITSTNKCHRTGQSKNLVSSICRSNSNCTWIARTTTTMCSHSWFVRYQRSHRISFGQTGC